MKKNEHNLRYLWDTIKCTNTNMHIMGLSEEERVEKIFKETMVKNFPNLIKDTPIYLEAQQTLSGIKLKKSHEIHRKSNRRKTKTKNNLESTRKKQIIM